MVYICFCFSSEAENDEQVRKELAGVEQADALKKLLDSDEEEEEKKEEEKKEDDEKKDAEEKEEKDKKKKKKKKKKEKKADTNKEGEILVFCFVINLFVTS